MSTSSIGMDTRIATGIRDKKVTTHLASEPYNLFIESPLPFFYFIFATNKPFSVVINKTEITLSENQCVFIKKSIPFSVLLDWRLNGMQRSDIHAVRFSSESISKFNTLHDSQFNTLKKATAKPTKARDYYFFDFSHHNSQELEAIRWMVYQAVLSNIEDKNKVTNSSLALAETIQNFLLAKLLYQNGNIGDLYHEPALETLSERVANIIINDYSINWTNEEIAKKLHVSTSSLKKRMYHEVGPISVFIHKIKLTECLRRIRRTNDSISHISTDMGYCSSSYFAKVFKKYFGIYPSEIRQNDKS